LKNYSDRVKLAIKAGNGGNGAISYFTDKRVRKGAPDGGDGGSGGDIVLQAHHAMHDLSHLRLKNIEGVDGQYGSINILIRKSG
jgi:GTP-binding protein